MKPQLIQLPNLQQEDVVATLKAVLKRAEAGEILEVNIAYDTVEGGWGTTASRAGNCRLSAAMLMELAMRRLGFGDQS